MSSQIPMSYTDRHEDLADAILTIVSEFGTDRWWEKSEQGALLLDYVRSYWPEKKIIHAHLVDSPTPPPRQINKTRGRNNMKSPTNTTREAEANPMLVLLDAMAGPGGIERSEKRGQSELVESDVIPTFASNWGKKSIDAELTALGFVLGDPIPSDPIFRAATLPKGWKKVGSDHSMWSKIVDETGKERCSIFYKAAFYDRTAFITICED